MRKNFYLTLALLLCASLAFAERITPEQALSIANAGTRSATGMKTRAAGPVEFTKVLSATEGYYVTTTASGRGFAIIAADDAVPSPVGAYSPDKVFPAQEKNLPPQLKAWLHDYSAVVKAIAEGRIHASALNPDLKGEPVAPMLKTKWNQDAPYNDLVPERYGEKCASGCVATAATQIMKYFNFPKKGKGEVFTPDDYYQEEKMDISDHVYDWENMLDVYNSTWDYDQQEWVPQWTDVQGLAVATLLRDFGYSVKMDYGPESAAYSSDVVFALIKNFSYSPEARYVERGYQSEKDWSVSIRESLKKGSPVYYHGSDGKSGHAFVCDGIDGDGMLHINWGWGGISDGYFDMNVLSPDNLGIGAGGGAYFRYQGVILYLKPGDETADNSDFRAPLTLERVQWGAGNDDDGKLIERSNFIITGELTNTSGANIGLGDAVTFLVILDKDGNTVYSNPEKGARFSLRPNYYFSTYYFRFDWEDIGDAEIPDGEYIVKPMYAYCNLDSEEIGEPLDFATSGRTSVNLKVKEGDFYVDPRPVVDEKASLAVIEAKADIFFVGLPETMPITIKVKNISDSYVNSYLAYLLVHEDEDTGTPPDDADWNTIECYIYPDVVAEVRTGKYYYPELKKAGKYHIYFKDWNTGIDIPTEEPIYITATSAPEDGILLQEPLRDIVFELGDYNYISTSIKPYIIGSYSDPIQVWAYPEGGSESDAFLLFTASTEEMRSDNNFWLGGVTNILMEKPLGRYVYWLKYKSGDEWKDILGSNKAILNFIAPQGDADLLELTAEAKIGAKAEYNPGDVVSVELRFKSYRDFNMEEPKLLINMVAADDPDVQTYSSYTETQEFSSLSIKKGEEFIVKGKYTIPVNLDCGVGREFVFRPTIADYSNNVYYSDNYIRTYPYSESLKKKIVPLAAEPVDVSFKDLRLADKYVPGDQSMWPELLVGVVNNAETALTHTLFNFYVLPAKDAVETPDYASAPRGNFVPSLEPGAIRYYYVYLPREAFPVYGLYRIYVTYEDRGVQVPVPGTDNLFINVADSRNSVEILSASDEYAKDLSPDIDFNISLDLRSGFDYYGPLEMWCAPMYGNGKEFKAATWNPLILPADQDVHFDLEASSDAFLNMPFGYYNCYFKVEIDGVMVKAEGDSNMLQFYFRGVASGVLTLEQEMEVEGPGDRVPQNQDAVLKLIVRAAGDMTLDLSKSRVMLIDDVTGEPIAAQAVIEDLPANLSSGMAYTLKVKFHLPEDADAVGRRVSVVPVFVTSNNDFCRLRTEPYQESLGFYQDETTGVGSVEQDSAALWVEDRTLIVGNADSGSLVEVYDTTGMRQLSRTVAGQREEISLEGLQKGIYIARAVCDGKVRTLKFAIR